MSPKLTLLVFLPRVRSTLINNKTSLYVCSRMNGAPTLTHVTYLSVVYPFTENTAVQSNGVKIRMLFSFYFPQNLFSLNTYYLRTVLVRQTTETTYSSKVSDERMIVSYQYIEWPTLVAGFLARIEAFVVTSTYLRSWLEDFYNQNPHLNAYKLGKRFFCYFTQFGCSPFLY